MTESLRRQLRPHAGNEPGQAHLVDDYLELLDEDRHAFLRERLAGHFTGLAWLVATPMATWTWRTSR